MNQYNKLMFVFFTILFNGVLFAQNDKKQDSILPVHLEEVMVTATRSIRHLSSLPLPAQLISKKDIERANAVRLSDLLNEYTGLTTVTDFGGGIGIQMQGLDAQHTLILIDGMPLVGRLAGTFDLNRLSVGNLAQVEIVKGASSSLYGSDALGGVINLISEAPKLGFHGNLGYRLSTFNSQDIQASISHGGKKLKANIFFNRLASDGYNLNNESEIPTVSPYFNYSFSSRFNYQLSESSALLLNGRIYKQDQDYLAEADLSGKTMADEWNITGKYTQQFSDEWESQLELYLTRYIANEYLNDATGVRVSDDNYDHRLMRPEFRTYWTPVKGQNFILGMGLNHESLDRTNFSSKPQSNAPYIYAQFDRVINDDFNLIIGSRFDMHSDYASQWSPKVALKFQVNDAIGLKGSVGVGFKAPDFRQLYFDFSNSTVGYTILGYNAVNEAIMRLDNLCQIAQLLVPLTDFNDQLKPENSLSINLGANYRLNNQLTVNANFFRNNIRDLIDTRIIAAKTNGQNVFSYQNIDKVYTQGLELDGVWKAHDNIRISAGYQLLYAKDIGAKKSFENGAIFARLTASSPSFVLKQEDYFGLFNRSRHMGNFKIDYEYPEWQLDANIRTTYRGKYGIIDANGNGHLDRYDNFVKAYMITDLALNKSFYKNYRLSLGINNLFNYKDPQNISQLAGTQFYTKLNIQF